MDEAFQDMQSKGLISIGQGSLKWQAVSVGQMVAWTCFDSNLALVNRMRLKLAPMPYNITEYSRN